MAYVYKEFPRTLHKPDGLTRTVTDELSKQDALADGWSLSPVINGHVIDFDEEVIEVIEDAPVEKKRGRKKA